MRYERVRKVSFHGPSEFGSDILPFWYVTPLGTTEYYAVQAKATTIHGTSAKQGNAAEIVCCQHAKSAPKTANEKCTTWTSRDLGF
jgi:hypothetical protein